MLDLNQRYAPPQTECHTRLGECPTEYTSTLRSKFCKTISKSYLVILFRNYSNFVVGAVRIELTTYWLKASCSTY